MEDIRICLFGKFEILAHGNCADNPFLRSRKSCLLIQYLILHSERPVTYQELYESIWPNEEISNPESALKTLISRLRVSMGKVSPVLADCIGTAKGAYIWRKRPEVYVDVYEFDMLCRRLLQADKLNDETEADFRRLYSIYQADLLATVSSEAWIVNRSVLYQDMYMRCVYRHLDLLCQAERFESVISVCRAALEINSFDERLHMQLMDALIRTDRGHEALIQYKQAADLHMRYLGMQPSGNMRSFYENVLKAGQLLDSDIESIRTELNEYSETKGAFLCEYPVFREIYNLHLRTVRRGGNANVFLVLLAVSPVDSISPDPTETASAMQSLLKVLRDTLRQNDTVSRYSPTQYVLLLSMQSYENGRTVMERIKQNFYKQHVTSGSVINYRITPIGDNAV